MRKHYGHPPFQTAIEADIAFRLLTRLQSAPIFAALINGIELFQSRFRTWTPLRSTGRIGDLPVTDQESSLALPSPLRATYKDPRILTHRELRPNAVLLNELR
jgi:hypothetical protein